MISSFGTQKTTNYIYRFYGTVVNNTKILHLVVDDTSSAAEQATVPPERPGRTTARAQMLWLPREPAFGT